MVWELTLTFVGEAQGDPSAQARVVNGEMQIVLISPENILCNSTYRNMMLTNVYKENLIGVAVDEAHWQSGDPQNKITIGVTPDPFFRRHK